MCCVHDNRIVSARKLYAEETSVGDCPGGLCYIVLFYVMLLSVVLHHGLISWPATSFKREKYGGEAKGDF